MVAALAHVPVPTPVPVAIYKAALPRLLAAAPSSDVGIRSSTAIFDGPAAQTHHAHRKRRAICKA